MRQVRFLEPAEAELEENVTYFDLQLPGLGERFDKQVEATLALITDHPEIGSPLTKRIRKFRVRKFRYNIIYAFDGDEIVVIAVAHHKKRPGYWRGRLKRSR
jgi:plasmid stabilization system protein ParE